MADETRWSDARQDYITSSLSYRQIAEKHNIPFDTLTKRAKKEEWGAARRKMGEETTRKTIDKIASGEARRYEKIIATATKALDRIEKMLDDPELTPGQLRALASALVDAKNVQGLKSELDKDEQRARIDKLRKDTERGDDSSGKQITVRIEGGGEWTN